MSGGSEGGLYDGVRRNKVTARRRLSCQTEMCNHNGWERAFVSSFPRVRWGLTTDVGGNDSKVGPVERAEEGVKIGMHASLKRDGGEGGQYGEDEEQLVGGTRTGSGEEVHAELGVTQP